MNFRQGHAYRPPPNWPHGTPYRIDDVHVDDRDLAQAAALVTRDGSTLDDTEANRLHTQLSELCERIQARAFGDDETTLVWYHPDTRDFWAYPGAPL